MEGFYTAGPDTMVTLYGNLSVSAIIFMGSIEAENDPTTNSLAITSAEFACTIDLFQLMLHGVYDGTGDLLVVSGSVNSFPEVALQVSITLNLTETPRRVDTVHFLGQLNPPLSGSVSTDYMLSSDTLVLNGMTEIGSQEFVVQVIFNTTHSLGRLELVRLSTTVDSLSLQLVGEYTHGMQQIVFMGNFVIQSPPLNLTASTNIDLAGNSGSRLSALSITV